MDFSPRFLSSAGYRNIVYREGKKVRDQTGFRFKTENPKGEGLKAQIRLWFLDSWKLSQEEAGETEWAGFYTPLLDLNIVYLCYLIGQGSIPSSLI